MSGDVVVGLVAATACLFLAWRGLSAHRLPFQRKAAMAIAWVVIIAALALVIGRSGG